MADARWSLRATRCARRGAVNVCRRTRARPHLRRDRLNDVPRHNVLPQLAHVAQVVGFAREVCTGPRVGVYACDEAAVAARAGLHARSSGDGAPELAAGAEVATGTGCRMRRAMISS